MYAHKNVIHLRREVWSEVQPRAMLEARRGDPDRRGPQGQQGQDFNGQFPVSYGYFGSCAGPDTRARARRPGDGAALYRFLAIVIR